MVKFTPNTPVVQPDAQVKVDVTADAPLGLGPHRFRLVVVDDSGNQSDPTFIDIIVKDKDKPTAVLQLVDANGAQINPAEVPFGASFILSGAKSSDVAPGKVAQYQFTLMPA